MEPPRETAGPKTNVWKAEWWQVAVGISGVAVAVVAGRFQYQQSELQYQQSDAFKVKAGVAKLVMPFAPPPPPVEHVIPRPMMEQAIKKRLETADRSTTLIAGQYQVGKSLLVNATLTGTRGVFYFEVDDADWKARLRAQLVGTTDNEELFLKVFEQAAKELGHPVLLYLDVSRNSKADIDGISTFCKAMVTNRGLARVVVLASQLTTALGFDAGGKDRQCDVWVGTMTEAEAQELLSQNYPQVLSASDMGRIIKRVGTVPGTLHGLMKGITRENISVDRALEDRYETCKLQVRALRAMELPGRGGKRHDVGKEIIQALLKSGEADAAVDHSQWLDKGILVKKVTAEIANMNAFAVSYNTKEERWHWASPMHREAAQVM